MHLTRHYRPLGQTCSTRALHIFHSFDFFFWLHTFDCKCTGRILPASATSAQTFRKILYIFWCSVFWRRRLHVWSSSFARKANELSKLSNNKRKKEMDVAGKERERRKVTERKWFFVCAFFNILYVRSRIWIRQATILLFVYFIETNIWFLAKTKMYQMEIVCDAAAPAGQLWQQRCVVT